MAGPACGSSGNELVLVARLLSAVSERGVRGGEEGSRQKNWSIVLLTVWQDVASSRVQTYERRALVR